MTTNYISDYIKNNSVKNTDQTKNSQYQTKFANSITTSFADVFKGINTSASKVESLITQNTFANPTVQKGQSFADKMAAAQDSKSSNVQSSNDDKAFGSSNKQVNSSLQKDDNAVNQKQHETKTTTKDAIKDKNDNEVKDNKNVSDNDNMQKQAGSATAKTDKKDDDVKNQATSQTDDKDKVSANDNEDTNKVKDATSDDNKQNQSNQDASTNNSDNQNAQAQSTIASQTDLTQQAASLQAQAATDATTLASDTTTATTVSTDAQNSTTEAPSKVSTNTQKISLQTNNPNAAIATNNSATDVKTAKKSTNEAAPSSTTVQETVDTPKAETQNIATAQQTEEIKPVSSARINHLKNDAVSQSIKNDIENLNQNNAKVSNTINDSTKNDESITAQATNVSQATQEPVIQPQERNTAKEHAQTNIDPSMLREMNAKVVSSTASSKGGDSGLLNQQNANEQVVKLSIEQVSSSAESSTVNFSNAIGSQLGTVSDKLANTTTVQQASTPKELSKADILNQINEKLYNIKTTGSSNEKIEMILKPESLGKINIQLQTEKGALSATLIAESPQVKEILEKNIDTLRNNLSAQGVNVNNLTVKVAETHKSESGNMDFAQGQFLNNQNQSQQQTSKNVYENDYNTTNINDTSSQTADEDIQSTAKTNPETAKTHSGMVDYKV